MFFLSHSFSFEATGTLLKGKGPDGTGDDGITIT
jgi:hypothetical protein